MNRNIFNLLVSGLLTLSSQAYAYELPPSKLPFPIQADTKVLEEISNAVNAIADPAKKALVFISTSRTMQGQMDPFEFFFGDPSLRQRTPKQEGFGSGYMIDLEKGYILTNNHVIADADAISLKLADGKSYEGKVIGTDKDTDVAVVQISEKFDRSNLASLVLDDSDTLKVGETVIALGAPFLLEASVSTGIVSALGRGNLEITQIGDFIQTDAAINPGNSGGPLINTKGKVIGQNTAIFSKSGAYAGIGFAVPSNLIRRIATALINNGSVSRGLIGIRLDLLRDEWLASLNLPKDTKGVIVVEIIPGGPAQKAGLESGDVIVGIDGKEFVPHQLPNIIGLKSPGSNIELTFYREGKKRTITVEVGTEQSMSVASVGHARKGNVDVNPFGFQAAPLNDKARSQYNVQSKSGLIITHIEPKSPSWKSGLEEGDVILGVNGKRVQNPKDFEQVAKGKDLVLLHIERKGRFYFVTLKGS
ncbi:MAG: Do family serine endopeptidase [Deltaproteobacteria bacterium]|nr:Do family serine endopeptidase [Deltaproteobacteria bacterium]